MTKLKNKMLMLLASIIMVMGFGFIGANTVKADISYGGATYVNGGGSVLAINYDNLKLHQAYFLYTGTAKQNSWIANAGLVGNPPALGQLVILQWCEVYNGGWKIYPMSYLRAMYTYSNTITTYYETDGSVRANATNWNKLVGWAGAQQRPRVLALAGGSFGIGNNTLQSFPYTYAVAAGPFWFSGTYGDGGGYYPGAGNGSGAGGAWGENQVGGGFLVNASGSIVTSIRANISPDVVLPPNESSDTVTDRFNTSKAVTMNDVTTSSVVRSKSSDDDGQYTIDTNFFSKAPAVYKQYSWVTKDVSYRTKTIENSYQTVLYVNDEVPKGFDVSDVVITTQTGKPLTVNKALSEPGGFSGNLVRGKNIDIADYYINPTTRKLTVRFVSGDMSENVTTGKLNRMRITIKGKLNPETLPTDKIDSVTGIGRINNTATVKEVAQRWVRTHTSGAGTKPQPYTFTASDGFENAYNVFEPTISTNTVGIDVKAYRLYARYMKSSDVGTSGYEQHGGQLAVNIDDKQVTSWTSPWTYPHLKVVVPTPSKTTSQESSQTVNVLRSKDLTNTYAQKPSWEVQNDSGEMVSIPDTGTMTTTVNSKAVINSSQYKAVWRRNLSTLSDQITNLRTSSTTKITATDDTYTVTMGDESQAMALHYGQPYRNLYVSHQTSSLSVPSRALLDRYQFNGDASGSELGDSLNVEGPVGSVEVGDPTSAEIYRVHEGETLNYSPQVTKISAGNYMWRLIQPFATAKSYSYPEDSNPEDSNPSAFDLSGMNALGVLALEYATPAGVMDSKTADVSLNPEKLIIDTDQAKSGLPFKLDLKANVGGAFNFLESNNIPGFSISNYRFNVKIMDGTKAVYDKTISLSEMIRSSSGSLTTGFATQLEGVLSTSDYPDNKKVAYQVYITPDNSQLKPLSYVGLGSLPASITPTSSTDTPNSDPFKSNGYTASNMTITSDDIDKDGQLSVSKDKLVVQTIAIRKPYSYEELHENWALSIPKRVSTLTGYSISGVYPITYSVDKASDRPLVDLSDKFKINYASGLNADRNQTGYTDEKKGVKVSPTDLSISVNLSNQDGATTDTDVNGVISRSASPAVPVVGVTPGDGSVSSKFVPNGSTILNGGNRIFISEWIENVPSVQAVKFGTRDSVSGLGVNNAKFSFKQDVILTGYLHGHAKSGTQSTDALLMQPVDRDNESPVSGYGYSKADNAWLKDDSWYSK